MNLLIVDDLISVVNGMIKGIRWEELGAVHIYKAYNAYEAKALLNNLQIDILLTDIEMPGESGLELAAWVREQGFDLEVIFLSSHANFSYARQAIAVDGYEYVLLPCPYEEIMQVIRGAVLRITQRREQERIYRYGKLLEDKAWLEHILFYSSLDRAKNEESISKLTELGSFCGTESGWLVLMTVIGNEARVEQCEEMLLEFCFQNVIAELLEPLKLRVLFKQVHRKQYVFLLYGFEKDVCTEELVRERLLCIEVTVRETMQIPVEFQSVSCAQMQELPDCYERLLRMGQVAEMQRESFVYKRPEEDVVETVRDYVRSHIASDIKRQDLAELVHLNIDYLSRIFKRKTGMTVNDYIVNEKMKVAENLLKTTGLPVSLIATKVGYSNFSYFSKSYKKLKGRAPQEERENR